jgi:hypothetical protein
VRFVLVYQREPHARQMAFRDVAQPVNREERAELAQKALDECKLDVDVWVDDLGDSSRAAFGDLPHAAVVIDPAGVIRLKLSWCEPQALRVTLPEVVRDTKDSAPPVEREFLAAIDRTAVDKTAGDGENALHHRRTMLAWLAVNQPAHADRAKWVEELADSGPQEQRTWATRLLSAGSSPSKPAAEPTSQRPPRQERNS